MRYTEWVTQPKLGVCQLQPQKDVAGHQAPFSHILT